MYNKAPSMFVALSGCSFLPSPNESRVSLSHSLRASLASGSELRLWSQECLGPKLAPSKLCDLKSSAHPFLPQSPRPGRVINSTCLC